MKRTHGFTLIELSIVLVIIGLIVGGVLVGRDLIEAAKIRSTVSQYEEYKTAVNTFRLKYDGLPGDIANPTQFGLSNPSTHTYVNKGNGLIESTNAAQEASRTVPGYESTHFWYHLSQTGLIGETLLQPPTGYLAPSGSPMPAATIAQYVPQPKLDGGNAYWYVFIHLGQQYYGIAGTAEVEYGYGTINYVFAPSQARSIDEKLDDGMPGSGKVQPTMVSGLNNIHVLSTRANCRTSDTAYALGTALRCNLRLDFQ